MPPLYALHDVKQVYAQRTVLEVPQLQIHNHDITGIYGPNGSGKSTLLRILALLETPAQGKILIEGHPVHPGKVQARREVTLLSQSPYLLKRSVLGNISYGLKLRGVKNRREKSHEAMEMVGLSPQNFSGRMWHELSGGEAQRVALAARLVLRPKILLLDEPTAYLDEESSEGIRSAALFARQKWGTALILVSHDQDWLGSVCDRILFMKQGGITEPRK